MYIGEAAKQTGLSVKAIRLYEEMGLIDSPPRQGRYRVYRPSDLELLKLIVEAKKLGVKLNELKSVILFRDGEPDWQKIGEFLHQVKSRLLQEQEVLNQKLASVDLCLSSLNQCPQSSVKPFW